ncbi:MAG: SRPBCC domain-containing protein [Nitrososphaerota archaeon]|nr:SRPBCC domain-containing protein [Candidatus Calditenuaceae archaeon]MDW8072669.1 SRPBCC domain-containing protein [Nitrososphaerota archaeon]
MRFSGSMQVPATPSETLRRLRDPVWLSRILPNLSSFEVTGEREFKAVFYLDLEEIAKVTGYLSRIRANMHFRYEDTGEDSVKVVGSGKVVGARIALSILVKVAPSVNGSVLDWEADTDLGIIQRLLGQEITRRVANRQIELLTSRLREELSTGIN